MERDPKKIYRVFIKFIKGEYSESFLDEGLLFMNTVEYFRKLENDQLGLRADKFEGLAASYDPLKVSIEIGGIKVNANDIVGNIDIRYNHESETNLFCLTAINDYAVLSSGMEFKPSKEFLTFGDKSVVITGDNISTFISRIKKAIELDKNISFHPNQKYMCRPVEYVNRQDHSGIMGIFRKYDDFAWQHEWRLAVKQNSNPGPYDKLKIGNIRDICVVYNTVDFLKMPIQLKKL